MSEQHYTSPIADIRFLLEEVLDLSGVFGRGVCDGVDAAVALAVLEQGGRFATEGLGPLIA